MQQPPRLLASPSLARKAWVILVAAVGSWALDALVAAATSGDSLVHQLLRPAPSQVFSRLLIAVLVAMLHRSFRVQQRLDIFSSALATAPDGIQITTLDGRVAYSNAAVREIYGFSPEELLGRHVNEMNADPTFASRVILPTLIEKGRWEGELDVKHKDGHVFPIWLTTSLVRSGRGRPIAAVGVIRDVSDRKRSEQELRGYAHRLEEATAMKDLFADILRHDLLGPASTVQLSLESVTRYSPDAEATHRMLATAQRSCAKLIAMIEGAAKYAKLSAAQQIDFALLDLGAILRDIVADSEMRRAKGRIVLEAGGRYPVRADAMIADVFENLVSNALKYGGGQPIRVQVSDEGDRWRVSVSDRGEGIPDEDKQKLFTRFERLRKEGVKGTGLGLAIAKRVVDLHGGSIWVEDNPGGGSVFCVALRKAG